MRPSLTLVIIILAVLFSLAAGLVLGGGPDAWLGGNQPSGISPNADMPVAPPTPTPPPVSQAQITSVPPPPVPSVPPPTLPPTATATTTPTPTTLPTATPTETPAPTATPSEITEAVPTPGVQLIVDTTVWFRTAPSTDSERVGTLNSGERVNVIGRTADWAWAQVLVESATTGWVTADAEFVTLEGDVDTVPVTQ